MSEGSITGRPFGASDDAPLQARGTLRAEEAAVPPVAADPVEASLQAGWAPGRGVTLALNGPRLDATLRDGLLRAELHGLPVAVGDARGPLNASLRADAADPAGTLRGQASVAADPARITVDAGEAGLSVRADLPAGARLRGVTLQRAVQLRAELTEFRRGPVTIETAGARLDGALDLDAAEPFRGALRTGADIERRLVAIARRDPWRLALDGDATLAPVAEALGVPLTGTLTLDGVEASRDGVTGAATLRLDGPVPAEVAWRDGMLDGRVDTPAGAAELTGTLALGTDPTAELTHPWGDVRLEGGALRGGGTVPAQAWRGVRAGPLPWSLRPTPDGGAWPTLELGDSVLAFTDGRLTADVDLPIEIGAGDAAASGDGEAGTARPARLHGRAELLGPDARLDLQLDGPGDARSSLRGPLDAAALQAELPAAVLSSAAALDAELPGALTLEGPVDLTRRAWSLRGAWAVGDDTLQVQSEGPDPARLEVSGAGLSASLQPGAVHVTAAGATPGTFLPALAGLRLDGRLRADLAAETKDRGRPGTARCRCGTTRSGRRSFAATAPPCG
ncbi:MAG: hypothetical protein U5K81_06810 [Trueperaceae bacterium]|nr:hypothetical protein [Trueperaceae bacterium]